MSASNELQRAVGKLITGKICGTTIGAETERLIEDGTMSGVTLFKDNVDTLEQLAQLIDRLMQLGGPEFLIAVDQEGGAVQRFDDVITPLPSAMALASFQQEAPVRELMRLAARQLRLLGVNCNLVPVLDVNSNQQNPIIGTRSFGSEPEMVARLARIVAEAHEAERVMPVGKHFPGHGDTFQDSHLGMAVVDANRATLFYRELQPFQQLSKSLPAMLMSHVWLKAYDQEMLPASLSRAVTTDLLRGELGFDGLVLTDDLPVMKAIIDHYGLEEAAVLAVLAGADNLLVSGTVEQISAVNSALVAAVSSGKISSERLQQSVRRRAIAMAPFRNERLAPLGDRLRELRALLEPTRKLALNVSFGAIKQIRGARPRVRAGSQWVIVAPRHPRYLLDLLTPLSRFFPSQNVSLHERRYSPDPQVDEIADVVTFARGKNVLYLTFRALLNTRQLVLGHQLAAAAMETVLIACDVPYDATESPKFVHAMATFDPSELAMEALAYTLAGVAPVPAGPVAVG